MEQKPPYRYPEYPYVRILRDWDTHRGRVVRFVVQLEYGLDDEFYWPRNCDDWQPVARFDHNPRATDGHDIREEGLHMDIYTDDEEYFIKNLDFLRERFEELHEVENNRWAVTLRQ